MRDRSGFTLIELVVVLLLTAILLGLTAPAAARWRDAAAVRAARDELASALALTRLRAVAGGGASLWVERATASYWTTIAEEDASEAFRKQPGGARARDRVSLGERYGVRVDPGGEDLAEIRYDFLGIGRLASRTVVVTRGRARGGVTVSAYGRVRRW